MNGETAAPVITGDSVVKLARGVRLREDPVRGQTVLLAPERALALDPIAISVVKALDGERSLRAIASDFAREFDAETETILADIFEMIAAFSERRLLEFVR